MKCRHCDSTNLSVFLDLGSAPPSNAYLNKTDLSRSEKWFPLKVYTCQACWLVQTEDFASYDELFDDKYAYFSSFSTSWLNHCEAFVEMATNRFKLDAKSVVVEVAANDGYLLQFVKSRNIPCYGIEPTKSTAEAARKKGIEIIPEFFGKRLGQSLCSHNRSADFTIANNVLAHVPDIKDFVAGFTELLKPQGVATFEFPHLLNLVRLNQFDTIYHEHFSYLSLTSVNSVFESVGLSIFDVEKLPTHGGSLRLFAQRSESGLHSKTSRLSELESEEKEAGLSAPGFYSNFQAASEKVKDDFLRFLLQAKADGKSVCGYGGAAKGNTLLNFAGIRPDLVSFVVDRNPAKQDQFMPGSRIPIMNESALSENEPDFVVIFPWNLADEIVQQLEYVRKWGAKFVVAVPQLRVM